VWTPIRTLIGRGVGHSSATNARWIARAAATALGADENTANRLSPSPRGRMWTPRCSATAASNSASWRASAARIASGASSQSAVLPSTSVSMSVTVPLGSSVMASNLVLAGGTNGPG
jgi:hypothetical protein